MYFVITHDIILMLVGDVLMKFINMFIIIITKIIIFILNLLGKKAGTVPGRIAIKLNRNIRDYLRVTGKIIVVTGTNGKTTTTSMIAEILEKSNKKVIYNKGGNNIGWGITTTLLKNCTVTGKINCDYLVLETDEHWVPVIYSKKNMKIDTLIVLNFFRDQLDRAGEIETIVLKLEKFIKNNNCNLILNGNDPNVVRLGLVNKNGKNYYYGIDKLSTSYLVSHDKMEGIICPNCKIPLKYDYYQYSHIGHFKCEKCGYGNISLNTKVDKIDGDTFYIGKDKYVTNNENLYNIYNLLSIVTLSDIYNIDKNIVKDVFKTYEDKNGRHQTFNINGRKCILNLGKNPTGFNVVLKSIKYKNEEKELLIVLNDNVNDGHDVSWIWDIDFTDMDGFKRIICTGTRAYDMAITIKCSGYKKENIVVEHNKEKAIDILLKTNNKKYIISNYSPLISVKETLEKLEKR